MVRIQLALACLLTGAIGCGKQQSETATPTANGSELVSELREAGQTNDSERTIKALEKAVAIAEAGAPAAAPVLELPQPKYWLLSEPRSMGVSHGFSVAYQHAFGPKVTLYQYTRDIEGIPNDIDSEVVLNELNESAKGVLQLPKLMNTQIKLLETEQCKLGDSEQRSHHNRYQLGEDDDLRRTDLFVWSCRGTFFKLRATWSRDSPAAQKVFDELLTAIGNACVQANQQNSQ